MVDVCPRGIVEMDIVMMGLMPVDHVDIVDLLLLLVDLL
jgi:hypothetical protein